MNSDSSKKQPDAKDKVPAHPSGTTPTSDDAESRMTSEGDSQNPGDARPTAEALKDRERPGSSQNRHGDRGGTS